MYRIAKNIVKNLVVSKEVAILAMPNSDTRITDTYFKNAITAYPCVPICFAGSHCLATKGGTPSFCTYLTKLLNDKCQTVKKLVGWGVIVPASHLTSKVPICTAATYVRRYLFSALTRLTIRMSTARRTHGTPSDISSPTSETLTPIIPCL